MDLEEKNCKAGIKVAKPKVFKQILVNS